VLYLWCFTYGWHKIVC